MSPTARSEPSTAVAASQETISTISSAHAAAPAKLALATCPHGSGGSVPSSTASAHLAEPSTKADHRAADAAHAPRPTSTAAADEEDAAADPGGGGGPEAAG